MFEHLDLCLLRLDYGRKAIVIKTGFFMKIIVKLYFQWKVNLEHIIPYVFYVKIVGEKLVSWKMFGLWKVMIFKAYFILIDFIVYMVYVMLNLCFYLLIGYVDPNIFSDHWHRKWLAYMCCSGKEHLLVPYAMYLE